MIDQPLHIKFENWQNPQAEFDLIRLEDLYARKNLNHSPYKPHLVEFYIMILFEEGQGAHQIDFTEYECQKGTLVTIRKDQIHQFVRKENVRGTLLLFTDEFLVSYLEKLEALKSLQLFNEFLGVPKIQLSQSEQIEVANLVGRIRQEYFKVNDEYSLGIIRSELHILLAKLFRIKSDKNQMISNRKYLSEFIDFQNLVEQNATKYTKVKDYGRMIGVSTKTLNTITKAIVNKRDGTTATLCVPPVYADADRYTCVANTDCAVEVDTPFN